MHSEQLTVYRFKFLAQGKEVSPGHMWGTTEAISVLVDCEPIATTERVVHRDMLDLAGFYYEDVPGRMQPMDEAVTHYAR